MSLQWGLCPEDTAYRPPDLRVDVYDGGAEVGFVVRTIGPDAARLAAATRLAVGTELDRAAEQVGLTEAHGRRLAEFLADREAFARDVLAALTPLADRAVALGAQAAALADGDKATARAKELVAPFPA